MRGIYTAAYLAWLSDRFARERNLETLDIGKGFDMVTGTSTGAIIGCAAASGILMSKAVELYRMHGPKIFTPRLPDGIAQAVPQLSAGRAHLPMLTRSCAVRCTRCWLTARSATSTASAGSPCQLRPWRWDNGVRGVQTSTPGSHRDDHFKLVDVCLASSAAPIYRSLAAVDVADVLGGHYVFADGGLWANNPVSSAYRRALDGAG